MNDVATVFTIIGATVTLLEGLVPIFRSIFRSVYKRGYSDGFEDGQRATEERVRYEADANKKAVVEPEVKPAAAPRKRWRIWGR